MTAVAVTSRNQPATPVMPSAPASLSLREAVSQVSDSSRNLLGLMALANAAERDLNSGSPETTLDGVISKAVLRSLLGALHYRDHATLRHSRRVALLAVGLAHHLGWEGRHLRVLEVAALLHDVGKIGVPDNVLYKPGKLNSMEAGLIGLHHDIGLNVLQACRVDADVLQIIEQAHHAHSSKSTDGRTIQKVHIGARILAVADAYESLCTEQTYRGAKPHDEIMKIMMEESGKQFDGNVVSTLARWVQQDGLPFAAQTAELQNKGSRRLPLSLEESAEAMALCQIFSYLHMLESLYDGFHLCCADRRFVVWSRGSERMLNRHAADVLGTKWSSDLFCPSGMDIDSVASAAARSTFDDAIAHGKTLIFQIPHQKANSTSILLELQTVPLFDADGRLHGVAEIYRDLANETSDSILARTPDMQQLKVQASRDALTSVANRGELERQLANLHEIFEKNPTEKYSVIFADADHFKRINDTHGHQVGDQVLIDLAKHFSQETYSGEIVGRYGGEEFVILCPGTDLNHAVRRANRLRCSLKNAEVGGVDRLKVNCSFGVAQIEPGETAEAVLGRADRALYVAKEAGRDRVCSYTAAQLLASQKEETFQSDRDQPFQYTGSFFALVASSMVIHKLGAFIKEHDAELVDVDRERVLMRLIGRSGLFGMLNGPLERQGIEIELVMEGADRAEKSQKLKINVEMRPYGRYRNANAFSRKTHSIMLELRQYFVAE